MATGDQVKALVRSHAEGDDTKFYPSRFRLPPELRVAARATSHRNFAISLTPSVKSPRGLRADPSR